MSYSNKFADILKALCAIAIILVSVNACTEVDDSLGGGLLPKNQKMKIRVKSLENGVNTYLFQEDSLISSRLGYAYFGIENSSVFGTRRNSFIVQFLPSSLPYDEGYGLDPIIDSLYLILPFYSVNGDTTQVQKFDVYSIDGPELLSRDSTYYTRFPIDDYKGDKLFTFTHTGRRAVGTKLDPTAAGKAYLESLVNLDMETYKDDSLFLKKYKGLYFTPASDSPIDAAVYSSALASAGLVLYVRNHDTIDVNAIYDTVASSFTFRDTDDLSSGYTIPYDNVSVNIVDFDFTGSTLGTLETATNKFTDTLKTSATQSLMYIQPMGGVTGFMRFTDQIIDELRNLRNDVDDEGNPAYYPSIMINQAMMYIWLEDASAASMNASMKRVGSYSNLRKLTGIPDYMYYYEAYYQANSDKNYMLPYNGYLNRSNGFYELDITSFVQQLAKGEPGDPYAINPVINLAPEAYGFFGFGQNIVQGTGSTNPIKIKLTYTLIDGADNDE